MSNQNSSNIFEGFEHKDLVGMIKPSIHIDDFVSKMGNDDNICVISFYISDKDAADDLVNWFESGYVFILDADRSPGEIKPNSFLVYLEIKRRQLLVKQLTILLNDMESLTEHKTADWTFKYKDMNFDIDELHVHIPLSPHEYRVERESGLNDIREAANLKTVPIYTPDDYIKNIQSQANII